VVAGSNLARGIDVRLVFTYIALINRDPGGRVVAGIPGSSHAGANAVRCDGQMDKTFHVLPVILKFPRFH
jgi:hypothetical protein